MKKVYTKPTVLIESFVLNQSIAVSCGYTDDKFVGFPTQTDKATDGAELFTGIPVWEAIARKRRMITL